MQRPCQDSVGHVQDDARTHVQVQTHAESDLWTCKQNICFAYSFDLLE